MFFSGVGAERFCNALTFNISKIEGAPRPVTAEKYVIAESASIRSSGNAYDAMRVVWVIVYL